jgi:two-component system OmpR family response regulator/two-component system response regulator QseB
MRILVVEDDPLLGDALQAGLKQRGFDVDWVKDGVAAELALRTESFAAVVLDLGLPRLDGLQLLGKERSKGSKVPVLVLTARDAVEDRVRGFDTGADDYVVKPVDLDELAARLRALVRRSRGEPAPILELGELRLDPAARTVVHRGLPVELQAKEFNLLHELMLNAGRVLSREQLEGRLYAWGEEVESNAVEVHVHHLRRKLAPELIRTVRGVGYVLPREQGHG